MPSSKTGYWFTSSIFEAEPGKDEETNPRMYGRQPAKWLSDGLLALGYPAEEVFGEDWGWCVMCRREPYSLFVGCVNLRDHEFAHVGDPPPPKALLLWNATAFAEVPFFKYAFRKKPDVSAGLTKLDDDLRSLLQNESTVRLVDSAASDHWFKGMGRMAANDQR